MRPIATRVWRGVVCVWSVEVHAVNETCTYLAKLVHEVGLELRSSAVCTALRRLRYGKFTPQHALLTKHCRARAIVDNIAFCRPLLANITGRPAHRPTLARRPPDEHMDQYKISHGISDDEDEVIDHHQQQQNASTGGSEASHRPTLAQRPPDEHTDQYKISHGIGDEDADEVMDHLQQQQQPAAAER